MVRTLRLYGQPSELPPIEWGWVDHQLAEAGTYWVTARTQGHPHPRPVWGLWRNRHLYLSIGTPITLLALASDPAVTVHFDSGADVVIVEGTARQGTQDPEIVEAYGRKYDRDYDVAQYGPLTPVVPQSILAWRTAGWAGRESFQQAGKWRFD